MQSGRKHEPVSKVILFRSGGLGDVLLTFPLLAMLKKKYREILLCLPSKYHFLVNEIVPNALKFDLDEGEDRIIKKGYGATVISFWDDPEWRIKWETAGAFKIYILDPRPTNGVHFSKSLIQRFKEPVIIQDLNQKWLLADQTRFLNTQGNLWIHPGSGSPKKNLPLSTFFDFADQWLKKSPHHRVNFSFGEADLKLRDQFLTYTNLQNPRIDSEVFETLSCFFTKLSVHQGPFIGNDSGPSHMAAMLGLDTHVFFTSTNPQVWSPLGPFVKIYNGDSVPKSIL